jgi:hypothetical protein
MIRRMNNMTTKNAWENELFDNIKLNVERDVYEHAFLRLVEEFAVDPDEILKESREYVKRRDAEEAEAFDRGFDEAKYWTENER